MPRVMPLAAEEAHRAAIQSEISAIVKFLEETLGRTLVAYAADTKDVKMVARWAKDENRPRKRAEERLRAVYQVFQLLQTKDSAHVVRAWFIGMNPQLEGEAPIEVIREGRFSDVWVAAQAYAGGG